VVGGATAASSAVLYLYLRALKSWRYGQLHLAHGAETKNKEKLKTKPSSSEETVQAIVREGSPKERSETTRRMIL